MSVQEVYVPAENDVEEIVRLGTFSADSAVIGLTAATSTAAARTRIAVEAAIRGLLANGYISIVHPGERPMFYSPALLKKE